MKVLRDIGSTLYDDDGCMSLPRLFCFVSFFIIVLSWILEQLFCLPFEHFSEITATFGIAMGGYVGKKVAEGGRGHDRDT